MVEQSKARENGLGPKIWEILPTGSSSLIPKLLLITWGEGRILEEL